MGRTGTVIALDICLDQLKTEGRVDVKGVVSFLRKQRTQMVQTQVHHVQEKPLYATLLVIAKQ